MMNVTRSNFFLIVAFVLFLLLTFSEAGVITTDMPWLLGGGLSAFVLGFLVP